MPDQPIPSDGVALALARVEGNRDLWLEGRYFELRSKNTYLQKWVGGGGTLWVVVSRPAPGKGRLYSLSFRFADCFPYTYDEDVKWGMFAIRGTEKGSEFYAENDARLLLLSLRFDNGSPLKSFRSIGSPLQTPRRLTEADAALMELYRPQTDVWGVFLSYSHSDEAPARQLRDSLKGEGVSVFRDRDSILAGRNWEEALTHAIAKSRSLVLMIGESTYGRKEVQKEVSLAQELGVRIIPVSLTGDLGKFTDLSQVQAIMETRSWQKVAERIAQSIPTVLQARDLTVEND